MRRSPRRVPRMLVQRSIVVCRFGWIASLILALASAAQAQSVTLALPVAASSDDLASVFEQGARLERERNWAAALSHYEDALKLHPGRAELQQLATQARAHYDVCRRYNDQAYIAALRTTSERDALAIYDEVLLKIQSHYVHEPPWQRLVDSGLTTIKVAVTEPLFVEKQLNSANLERLAALEREAGQLIGARRVADRRQ